MVRKAKPIATAPRLPIQSMDTVRTGAGRVKIVFVDNSTVSVTEQSKLIIDSFVYDPNPKKSRMALKFATGTVRFATGGKGMPKSNISLRTPSATIAVRGTDFTSTVDDFGKSLIILLPEPDGSVGEITVANAAGVVVLNRAFQATIVDTFDSRPSQPVILNLTLDMIDNMMIVSPPEEVQEEETQQDSRANLLDLSELDIDYLRNDDLESDTLGKDYLSNVTFDANLFEDFLAGDNLSSNSDEKEGVRIQGTTFGYNEQTQIYTMLNEDTIRVLRGVNNVTEIITPKLQNTIIDLVDSGKQNIITINNDGGSRIIVRQSN